MNIISALLAALILGAICGFAGLPIIWGAIAGAVVGFMVGH